MYEYFGATKRFRQQVNSEPTINIPFSGEIFAGIKFIEPLPEEIKEWRIIDNQHRVAVDWMPTKVTHASCQLRVPISGQVMIQLAYHKEISFIIDYSALLYFREQI